MLEKDTVREFYDRMWAAADPGLNRHERHRFGAILSIVRSLRRPNRAILDAGCGRGKLSSRLQAFGEVTGIDWSAAGVEAARQQVPMSDFAQFDLIRDDPAPLAARFGLAVSTEVLEHVGIENRTTLMNRLYGCLVPGGYLVLTTPNRARAEALADVLKRHQPEEELLSVDETLGLVEGAGFSILRVGSATFMEGVWERSSVFRRLRTMLPRDPMGRDPLDRLLASTRLGLYLIVLARKPG